jgi:hypothetical protein
VEGAGAGGTEAVGGGVAAVFRGAFPPPPNQPFTAARIIKSNNSKAQPMPIFKMLGLVAFAPDFFFTGFLAGGR